MKREYSTNTAADVLFFIGDEIEHTMFYGMKTLFVVGLQPLDKIAELATAHGIQHIFLGANHSRFDQSTAQALLDQGFYVTIDCNYLIAPLVKVRHQNFCLLLRYEFDENLINSNTFVKFYSDDPARKGIYVIPSTLLQEDKHFTDNSEYKNDIIINNEE